MPDRVELDRFSRLLIACAAMLGAGIATLPFIGSWGLTRLLVVLDLPAAVLIPLFLEWELRYPAVRQSRIAFDLVLLLAVVLNAALYGWLAHSTIRWRRSSSRQ